MFIKDTIIVEYSVVNCIEHYHLCHDLCDILNVLWISIGGELFGIVYLSLEGSVCADQDS